MRFDKYEKMGAYHYGWYETEPWYRRCVDKCVDFCKGSTLDVGCGDGVVMSLIKENGYRVWGYENDPEALKMLGDKGLDVSYFDIEEDSLDNWSDEPFEYLVCLNVIEHLQNPRKIKELVASDKILKGAIIITDMPQENPSEYHLKELFPFELASLFRKWRVVPFQVDENFHGIEVHK